MRPRPISEAEIARAKAQMKAGLLMALESSGARIEQLARQVFAWGRPIPLAELVARIEAVTVESARAAGRAMIARGRPAIAALGPGPGLESAATIAESLSRRAALMASIDDVLSHRVSFSEQSPSIVGDNVFLRAPQMADYAEWVTLREASRDFLTPWEPTWPADDLTRGSFRRRIKRYSEDQRSDLAYPFFIFPQDRRRPRRRPHACQYPARLRPGRQSRLLDGSGLCRQGLHDRRRWPPCCRLPSARCGCIGSRRPAFPPTSRRSGCSKRPAFSARGLPANISASTGSGRTICSMRV